MQCPGEKNSRQRESKETCPESEAYLDQDKVKGMRWRGVQCLRGLCRSLKGP